MASLGDFLSGLKHDATSVGQFLSNRVAQPAANFVANNVVQPVVNDFRDLGHEAAYGLNPQNVAAELAYNQNPNNQAAQNRLLQIGDAPVSPMRSLGATAGLASFAIPGLGGGMEALSPAARFAAGAVLRGGEAAGIGATRDFFNTGGNLQQTARNIPNNFLFGAGAHAVFNPGATVGAVNDVASNIARDSEGNVRMVPGHMQIAPESTQSPLETPPQLPSNSEPPPPLPQPRQFGETVKNSPQTTPEVASQVGEHYVPRSNLELLNTVQQKLSTGDTAAAHALAGQASDEGTVAATLLAKHYENVGDPTTAASVVNDKMRQLTEQGRAIQAASLWNKLSPETIGHLAAKTIQDYNENARKPIPELSGQDYQNVVNQAKQLQNIPEGPEKMAARQKLLETVHQLVPSSTGSKIFALWRTGLLTGPQTIGKIAVGHGVMSPAELTAQGIGGAVDKGISLFSGQRGLVASPRGYGEGFGTGLKGGANNLVHGIQDPNLQPSEFQGGHQQVNFGKGMGGKLAQTYVDTVGRVHGSIYQPFYGAHLQNSLYNQGMTAAINQGLSGAERESFVNNFVHDPTPQAVDIAHRDASNATFQQTTKLGQVGSAVQQKGGAVGKALMPFTRVPGAVVTDLVNYSPVGAAKSIIEAIQRGEFTPDSQRQLSQGIGRSITGTGVMAIGAALYNKGMMSLGYPLTDKKQQALDQLQGKTPNSILIGGKWRALNSLGPVGDALAVGANYAQGLASGVKSTKTGAGVGGALQQGAMGGLSTVANSPFLQGINNFEQAMQDPAQYGTKVGEGFAKSVMPTIFNKAAQAIDPLQRETNGVGDAFKSTVPWWRESLTPKTNVLGQDVPRANSAVGSMTDPFYSSTNQSSPVISELQRLQTSGNPATPDALKKNVSAGGTNLTLNPQQLDTLNRATGGQINQTFQQIMADPHYADLFDADKAKLLNNAVSEIRTTGKSETVNGLTVTGAPSSDMLNSSTGLPSGVTSMPDGKLKYQQGSVTKTYDPSTYDNTFAGFKTLMGNKTLPDALKQAVIQNDPNAQAYQQRYALETQLPLQQAQAALNLERYKTARNLNGWMQTATGQLQTLQQYQKSINPQDDPLQSAKTQMQIDSLQNQINQYQAQGGFTKPKKGRSSGGGSGVRTSVGGKVRVIHPPSTLTGMHRPRSLMARPSIPHPSVHAPHVKPIKPPKSRSKQA